VAIPVNAHLLADLFCLDIKSPENPDGTLSPSQLYKALLDVRTFGFNNNDPALAWNRRRFAQDGVTLLSKTTDITVGQIAKDAHGHNFLQNLIGGHARRSAVKQGSLRWYGQHIVTSLLASGKKPEEVSEICWMTAVAGVGVVVGLVNTLS
jgi:hypothetical protein